MNPETTKVMIQGIEAAAAIATAFGARTMIPYALEKSRARITARRLLVSQASMIPEILAAVERVGDRVAMAEARSWSHCQLDPDRLIFEANADGEWIRVNHAMMTKTGRTIDELLGLEWLNMIDPFDRHRVRAEWQAALSDGREFEQRCLITTSFLRRMEMTFHAIPTRRPCTGALIGFTGHLMFEEKAA